MQHQARDVESRDPLAHSGALKPRFFKKARSKELRPSMEPLVKEWFPVTRAFCLAVQGFTGVLAEECWRAEGRRRTELEEAMLEAVAISAGELGMGAHGVGGVHYNMFSRLGRKLGLSPQELEANPEGTLPETRRLVAGIRESLRDPYRGAGCLRVVEGTAFNIVEAMDFLFRGLKDQEGAPLYDAWEMEYVDLHLELEKEHDEMTERFLELLSDSEERARRIEEGVAEVGRLFAEFWNALEPRVFVVRKAEPARV